MNTMVKMLLVGLMAIMLLPTDGFAQRKKQKKQETREITPPDQQQMDQEGKVAEGYILLKAVELDFGKFDMRIHAGFDREGNERKVASNVKEQERLQRITESRSLVNMLTFLHKIGYKIETSYSTAMNEEVSHYYLLNNMIEVMDPDAYPSEDELKERRGNQNRPKLSPEEIEKRKRARQMQQDRR